MKEIGTANRKIDLIQNRPTGGFSNGVKMHTAGWDNQSAGRNRKDAESPGKAGVSGSPRKRETEERGI